MVKPVESYRVRSRVVNLEPGPYTIKYVQRTSADAETFFTLTPLPDDAGDIEAILQEKRYLRDPGAVVDIAFNSKVSLLINTISVGGEPSAKLQIDRTEHAEVSNKTANVQIL